MWAFTHVRMLPDAEAFVISCFLHSAVNCETGFCLWAVLRRRTSHNVFQCRKLNCDASPPPIPPHREQIVTKTGGFYWWNVFPVGRPRSRVIYCNDKTKEAAVWACWAGLYSCREATWSMANDLHNLHYEKKICSFWKGLVLFTFIRRAINKAEKGCRPTENKPSADEGEAQPFFEGDFVFDSHNSLQ